MKVEFVQLEQCEEYRGLALLERVMLGDTVTVEFPLLNVSAAARAVAVKYKPLLNRYDHITIGKVRSNLATDIVEQKKELEKKPDYTTMQDVINAVAKTILGAKGGCVRHLDTDGDGMPDTLYIADNPDPNQAKKVWRYNYEGWAASQSGYNGPFTMAATLENGFLADFITAAKLTAGTIQSADGKSFFLDLDNGIMRLNSQKATLDGDSIATKKDLESGIDHVITKTGFEFGADGLNVSKAGSEMSTKVTEDGMKVFREMVAVLIADHTGVQATNLRATTYLIVGGRSRFENYGANRTGCFWIGGKS